MRLDRLLKFILVTLPLTNSVTLPLGFPLKLYELAGLVALGTLLLGGGVRLGRQARLPVLWGVFYFGSFLASAWGFYVLMDLDLSMLEWAHGRYHPLANTVFHYLYLAFDIGLMVLVLHALGQGLISLREFCRFWLYGSLLAVAYAVALNLVLAAGMPAALLLRWDEVQYMNLGGLNVARTGPFEEGNYFGFYLLASTVITLWGTRRWPDRFFRIMLPVLLLGIVITASPAAMMGALLVVFAAVFSGGVPVPVRGAAIGGMVAAVAVLIQTGLFRTLVLDKFSLIFFGGVTDVTNVSLIQRMNESYHAWQMFLDYPFGIGMGNFGYFFGQYPDLYTWLISDFASFKRIANNIYLEVLCEHGIVIFGLFLYLLYAKVRRLLVAREFLVAAGLVLLCGYFLAFPTFRLSLIWVFWGYVIHLGRDAGRQHAR